MRRNAGTKKNRGIFDHRVSQNPNIHGLLQPITIQKSRRR
jgi:hypothetical protein